MKKYLLFFVLSCFLSASGQVTFVIDSLPAYTPSEDVLYIAGSFQGWDPGDADYVLHKNDDDKWTITLDSVAEGTIYQFKFTRGDWGKVEKGPEGEEINDRRFTFGNGETVHVIIYNWADFGEPIGSTAAWNVSVMDDDFYMPQLDRNRRIWIYLPPGYDSTDISYPVLYMHDGQNLFDVQTSYAGEWEVDETLNKLADQRYHVPIVVGIDNGGVYRTNELTPWYNNEYGGGQGDEYLAFIVETLKPYIDSNYRTMADRDNTGIMGSSLGGLISTYGALKYQDVFSKSGPFSPAYWINYDSIFEFVSRTGKNADIRFYQNVGSQEGDTYIDMMHMMEDSIREVGFENISSKVIQGGGHNEATWRDDFADAYLYLFISFANEVLENPASKTLEISPNPATDWLLIKHPELRDIISIRIFDSKGNVVLKDQILNETGVDISYLPNGIYFISITTSDSRYSGQFIKN